MTAQTVTVTGYYRLCPTCLAPATIVGDLLRGPVTVARNGDQTLITPHTVSCPTAVDVKARRPT